MGELGAGPSRRTPPCPMTSSDRLAVGSKLAASVQYSVNVQSEVSTPPSDVSLIRMEFSETLRIL